jgi:hypothetical protein
VNTEPLPGSLSTVMSPALRELVGVAHEIEQRLPQPHLVGMQRADRTVAANRDLVGILRRQRFDGLDHVVDERRKREIFELQLHPAGFDLREVEDVVYQSEQVPRCPEHAVERFEFLIEGGGTWRAAERQGHRCTRVARSPIFSLPRP